MGVWSYRHRRLAATAGALCFISVHGRRDAVFGEKIPCGANAWTNRPILRPGVSRGPLRTARADDNRAAGASSPCCGDRADRRGADGSHLPFREEKEEIGAKVSNFRTLYMQGMCRGLARFSYRVHIL